MAGVITTGNHPKALWPGIEAWFGRKYDMHEKFCESMFDVVGSKKKYEENVESPGFGLAPIKAEGSSVMYDSDMQGPVTRYTHDVYSLGYIVTEEEMDDNLYAEVSKTRAEQLAFSMYTTKEIVAANVYNRAFNVNYPGGNGVSMINSAQPTEDGIQSNELTVAADLSEASLEALLIQIMNAKNSRGLEIALRADQLIVSPTNAFEAQRILHSTLQSGTANNDINAVRDMGLVPGGFMANPYLTDADAWFLRTNAPNGTKGFMRKALAFTRDNDFDTSNAKAKASERYVFGWSDWRGVFGSAGAA